MLLPNKFSALDLGFNFVCAESFLHGLKLPFATQDVRLDFDIKRSLSISRYIQPYPEMFVKVKKCLKDIKS